MHLDDREYSEESDPLRDFLEVMRRLRVECNWKAAQTHRSLVRYLLEETHEAVEAIEQGTPEDLREELGDLLLQVYFHAVIAEESGSFTLDEVARDVIAKMHRRNPHVFGDAPGGTAAEIDAVWQSIKAEEKSGRPFVDSGLPASLPALLYADKMLARLDQVEIGGDSAQSIGERLLALVQEAREVGVDPEQALRDAVHARLPGER